AGFTHSAAMADGENVGDTQRCVYLSQIKNSSAIDDSTVLIEMRGNHGYKRVDFAARCHGLKFSGFAHGTPTNRLCTSNSITVLDDAATPCMIDQIVTIDETEAAALRDRR
ncbi:MAG: hypothetical protein RLN70_06265, partial [Rhodospirillaceae bacterium]